MLLLVGLNQPRFIRLKIHFRHTQHNVQHNEEEILQGLNFQTLPAGTSANMVIVSRQTFILMRLTELWALPSSDSSFAVKGLGIHVYKLSSAIYSTEKNK